MILSYLRIAVPSAYWYFFGKYLIRTGQEIVCSFPEMYERMETDPMIWNPIPTTCFPNICTRIFAIEGKKKPTNIKM